MITASHNQYHISTSPSLRWGSCSSHNQTRNERDFWTQDRFLLQRYTLTKQIEWQCPEYGEDEVVVRFGGLHIERAVLRLAGTILRDSGWTSTLSEAGVASPGTAESFLLASSVTWTKKARQVTACCLWKLMKALWQRYCNDNVVYFVHWSEKRRFESPQFCFWDLVMSMALTLLTLGCIVTHWQNYYLTSLLIIQSLSSRRFCHHGRQIAEEVWIENSVYVAQF